MPLDIIFQSPETNIKNKNHVLGVASRLISQKSRSCSVTCDIIPHVNLNRADPLLNELSLLAREAGVDIAIVPSGIKLADFRAFFFDMDSTFVTSETLDEMACIEGLGKECAAITKAAMDGTLQDYAASLRARVKLLKGRGTDCIDVVWNNMRLFDGLEKLINYVLGKGLLVYIVSSGFTIFTQRIAAKYGLTGACSNIIEIDGNTFTGNVSGPMFAPFNGRILDAAGKAEFVTTIMTKIGATSRQSVCFGDGSNDVKMLSQAGLAIGNHPKPVLRPHCDLALDFMTYDSVLNLFSDFRDGF